MHFTSPTDYMKLALQLAEQGRHTVSPNPMVGCVLVKNGHIVGEGYHQRAGEPHAEVIALQQAGSEAKNALAFVTLEPCCHHGRTPPCTQALIKAGIQKIYIACEDPNPLVAGAGIQALRAAGIEVETGVYAQEAQRLNEIFFHYIRYKQPFVIAKWAMSLDGKTITHPQDTRDISNPRSRSKTHLIRQQVDAILIGANTALNDDPLLTVRLDNNTNVDKQPLRIVLSSRGGLPLHLQLFSANSTAKTLVATTTEVDKSWSKLMRNKNIEVLTLPKNKHAQVDLHALLHALGQREVSSLLVEGGMTVHTDFFNENLVNKIQVDIAPIIIGEFAKKKMLTQVNTVSVDSDLHITADFEELAHV